MNGSDAIEAALAAFEAHNRIDTLEHPWRHTDVEYENAVWGHIDDENARELIILLHEPSVEARQRVKYLMQIVQGEPTHIFWPVFLNTWQSCEPIWPYRNSVLQMLRCHAAQEPARNYMHPDDVEFFDCLPPVVNVFRGCGHNRVRGISWTTDESVARQYAGAICNNEQSRVLAMARIPKQAVFAAFVDIGESEIIVDPRHLRRLRSVAVTPKKAPSEF